jgi:hypothetical protein
MRRLSPRSGGSRLARLAGGALLAGTLLAAAALSPPAAGAAGRPAATRAAGTTSVQVRKAVTAAFSTVFDLSDPALSPKLAAIQDGSSLKAAMAAALRSPLARRATGAKVLAVVQQSTSACRAALLPAPCAAVRYEILGKKGTVFLAGAKGYAVYQRPRWKVAKSTICALLSLESSGKAPAGC